MGREDRPVSERVHRGKDPMDGMDKRNNVRVPLQVVIDAVEAADNEWNQFLDIETMEAVSVPESLFIDNFGDEYQKLSDMINEGFNSRFFVCRLHTTSMDFSRNKIHFSVI